jgi:crotonobetainyl-CoA:carnitine CoA-transferase CaiB-like acyl-CoA transferase
MRYIGASKAGMSALFANYNRGKQSIRMSLKNSTGQELVSRLIPDVEIVIHNFRPGVMDKLNLGSEQLCVRNS